MSRREDRSSESKRHRSRFDREPSPKRSRRDGKPETERPPVEPDLDKDRSGRSHRHRRRLQDPLPLETVNASRESDKGADGHKEVVKHSSEKIPQSSYSQHDDRGSDGQNGRGFNRRTDSERGWWRDSKEQWNDRSIKRTISVDAHNKDEKSKDNNREGHTWRHDGYFEMEANPNLSTRRRPAFREQKIPSDPERTNKFTDGPEMLNPRDHATDSGRRNDRGCNSRYNDRVERTVAGQRESNKAQSWRGSFPSGDRSNANTCYRGGDGFSARHGGRVEKWKHDLFDEANKSPPRKNEDDQLSKIEALLTS